MERLSTFSRHVWFDPRGRGASDPLPHVEQRIAEVMVDDMLALLDYLQIEQVAVLGLEVPTGVLFAASHPERTKRWCCTTAPLATGRPRTIPGYRPIS